MSPEAWAAIIIAATWIFAGIWFWFDPGPPSEPFEDRWL